MTDRKPDLNEPLDATYDEVYDALYALHGPEILDEDDPLTPDWVDDHRHALAEGSGFRGQAWVPEEHRITYDQLREQVLRQRAGERNDAE